MSRTFVSHFLVPGLSRPVYKEYHRTLIQERDRDMTGDRSYDDQYNIFSCLSRSVRLAHVCLHCQRVLLLSLVER